MDTIPNFTDDEKRLLLSEMIKTSQVDVELLARFVASHELRPHWEQWTRMQIPANRTMAQCMKVADHLTAQASQAKRKRSSEGVMDGSTKRPSLPGGYASANNSSYHASNAMNTSGPVNIAPRPSNGHRPSPIPSPPPISVPAVKKRGRPSRADKAKRDLRPLLPQHIVPRPSDQSLGSLGRQSILPAPVSVQEHYPRSPVATPRTPLTSGLPPKRALPPHSDMSRPVRTLRLVISPLIVDESKADAQGQRVLSDGAVESTRAYLGSELPPIEPRLRAGISRQSPPDNSPTMLAPLLQQNSPAAAAETPSSQGTRSTPVTNSA